MNKKDRFTVYDEDGVYQATVREEEAAAVLVAFFGNGSTIRDMNDTVVYTQGVDGDASESYDKVAVIVWDRVLRNMS
jgi:hypothetical protein